VPAKVEKEVPQSGTIEIVDQGELLFEGALDDLVPHDAGNRYVYRVSGGGREERIAISTTAALEKKGDFRVTVMEGDKMVNGMHMRDDGESILVVGEAYPESDLGFAYARPRPLVTAPLHGGQHKFTSRIRVWRPSDGHTVGHGQVDFTVSTDRAPSAEGDDQFLIRSEGIFRFHGRVVSNHSAVWLKPGIGYVRSETTTHGRPTEYHELICAQLRDEQFGDCTGMDVDGPN
jgi:hypothetical protein